MQGRMRFAVFTLLAMMMLGLLTACGGGVSDTTIPAPPNSSPVTKGEDATTDLIIDAMDGALLDASVEENASVDQTSYYNSSDDLATVTSFYTSEMTNRGWEETMNQPSQGATALFYEDGDQAAMVMVFDASLFGGSGSFVMASNLSK